MFVDFIVNIGKFSVYFSLTTHLHSDQPSFNVSRAGLRHPYFFKLLKQYSCGVRFKKKDVRASLFYDASFIVTFMNCVFLNPQVTPKKILAQMSQHIIGFLSCSKPSWTIQCHVNYIRKIYYECRTEVILGIQHPLNFLALA